MPTRITELRPQQLVLVTTVGAELGGCGSGCGDREVVARALRVVRVVMAVGEVCRREDSPAVLAPEGKLLRDAICVGVRAWGSGGGRVWEAEDE